VRASTAAPYFFDPELLPVTTDHSTGPVADVRAAARAAARDDPWISRFLVPLLARFGRKELVFNPKTDGLFVDGGVTPYNNPSMTIFLMTMLKPYGLCWATGTDNLAITSIGTGSYRPRLEIDKLGIGRFAKLTFHALMSLMNDTEVFTLKQMQWMGEPLLPWPIDSEVGTLAGNAPPGGKMFRFLRYDVRLEKDWLAKELDLKVSHKDLLRYRGMDDPGIIPDIYHIGQQAARKQVSDAHWQGAMADWCAGERRPPPRQPISDPLPVWERVTRNTKAFAEIVRKLIRLRS
jgi:hypothetical protein